MVKVLEAHECVYPINILVYEFEHITKEGGMWVIKVLVAQARVGLVDHRCSETPQFVTTAWGIRTASFH
jgi:hypothetical protein